MITRMGDTPQPAIPMIPYATPMAPPRPATVSVIGIIGIVYASLGLLTNAVGILSSVIFVYSSSLVQSGTFPMEQFKWNGIIAGGGLLLAGLLLPASIGVVRMRAWGRRLTFRWAWAYLAWQVATLLVQMLIIVPSTMAMMAATAPPGTPGAAAAPMPPPAFMTPFMYASALVTLVMSVAFPICALYFLSRPPVREAFDRAESEEKAGPSATVSPPPVPLSPPPLPEVDRA